MTNGMTCFVLHGPQDIRAETRPIPAVGPGQALVRIRRVGICGSDIHYYLDGHVGAFVPKRPFILGHEGAGEIAEVGSGVEGLVVGMRVAIDPSHPCFTCDFCLGGRYNLCPRMRFLGSASTDPHMDGVFGEYVALPSWNLHPIPDTLSYAEAALIEPLSVAIHAVRRAASLHGASVLVTGGGPIGQLVLLVARAFGAGVVALSDPVEERRTFALAHGADLGLDPAAPNIKALTLEVGRGGFDLVVECSGAGAALRQAIELARRGGSIVQVGTLPGEVPLPANSIMAKELQVLGSFRFANAFPTAIALVASGRLDLVPLITRTFALAQMPEALVLASARTGVIKVQVAIEE